MDFAEEQKQELEALEAIYGPELQTLDSEYPNIKFSITLSAAHQNTDDSDDLVMCSLDVEFPENYPEVIPSICLTGLEEQFGEQRTNELIKLLQNEAEENSGMAMVFTVVSKLQEEMEGLVSELERRKEEEKDKVRLEREAEDRKKIEGTPVTVETFIAWKTKFEAEMFELKAKIKVQEQSKGRLTGKEQFLQDATLNLSDIGLLEESALEIDESLFDNLDELDIEDEEDED